MRTIGTKVMGIRTPIIQQGDDLAQIVVDSLLQAAEQEGFAFHDRDVVGMTEAIVARSQGNYATVDQIAACVRELFPQGTVGLVFPILSRNRFAMLLKGIARGVDKLVVQLSYPADEVGNEIVDRDRVDAEGLNPYSDVLTEADFRKHFGQEVIHRFTGVDYVSYYGSLGDNIKVILSANPRAILSYTDQVIAADIHTRKYTRRSLERAGARKVVTLDQLLCAPVDGSGYNEKYGLLGSNKATEEKVKLFPRDCQSVVDRVAAMLKQATGKDLEVMVYGDGGFKDPVGGIWELADPVVSPAYTAGLVGTPNELKLKYLADTKFAALRGEQLRQAMQEEIAHKTSDSLVGNMAAQGTTPRQLTDLLGSLCDLTSGSGDKGTPVVLIQGYFDNYATEA